LTSLQK